MTLRAIVAALGGDLYAGGLRANIPAPGHSPADRSVSLRLTGDRLLIHCFGNADWKDVRDMLRSRGLLGRLDAAAPDGAEPATVNDAQRRRVVLSLWEEAQAPHPAGLAARHFQGRGVRRSICGVGDLRFHASAPVSVYRPGLARRPALLAAVRDAAGELSALEITYLNAAGGRARDLRLSRKTVGRLPAGSAVRLDAASSSLLVAEGVFSALSASEHFRWPAWALLSAGNLARWSPPAGVTQVLIAADRGQQGECSAQALRSRLLALAVVVSVRLPPSPYGDWNEAMQDWRLKEGRGGAPGLAEEGSCAPGWR